MNKVILVTYIATGKYFRYADNFLKQIGYMFPDRKKVVNLITDQHNIPECTDPNVSVFKTYITHYPWPIVTLFKFRHMLDAIHAAEELGYEVEYVVNLDATVIPNRVITEDELLFKDKLAVFNNWLFGKVSRPEIDDAFWCDWDHSRAWRDSRKIQYQAFPGFFCGPRDITVKCCEDIEVMIEADLKDYIIPYFHDESYYNKWLDNNPQYINLINNQVYEDDLEVTWDVKDTAMWRVLPYVELQKEKHNE